MADATNGAAISVAVQHGDFDVSAEIAALRGADSRVGAVAAFIGTVRDVNDGAGVAGMTLEHYPGMTERSLQAICEEAAGRWPLYGLRVIHRIGALQPLDQIVLVVVSCAHRGDAFDACEFVMDYLKTRAPFWKKETTAGGQRWVQARGSDDDAAARWLEPGARSQPEPAQALPAERAGSPERSLRLPGPLQ